jgi:sulfur-oxidizing protein SoxY
MGMNMRATLCWKAALTGAALAAAVGAGARGGESKAEDPWPELAQNVFGDRPLADGTGLLTLEMPVRAEDAAIVPVTMRATLPPGDARRVNAITLIIDENPSPVAATFKLGANANVSAISTRVRVNAYTNVHAVAELSDGRLYVVKTYVKASGGCSAPALKNADEAKVSVGQMRFRQFGRPAGALASSVREAQIMVRHPNNSGLQMDQVTQLYIPPYFIHQLRVRQGDEPVLAMEGGISISEDPNIRFTFVPNNAAVFRVEAVDTDSRVFTGEWPADPAM